MPSLAAEPPVLREYIVSSAAKIFQERNLVRTRKLYHGLAQPLTTAKSATALLAVRSAPFSSAEVSAFGVLGNVGRLVLDHSELTGLYSTQKHDLDQLLEISAELGDTARLESFLPRFVVRAADFLGFSRAFVALVDSGECRLRWGASKGAPSRLEIDISAVGSRVLELRNPYV